MKIIQQNCEELNLTDIWRTMNADKHRYTWPRKKPEIQCRLDFFLISSDSICDINLADIVPGCKADHSMILLVALHHNPRGRGFWEAKHLARERGGIFELNQNNYLPNKKRIPVLQFG